MAHPPTSKLVALEAPEASGAFGPALKKALGPSEFELEVVHDLEDFLAAIQEASPRLAFLPGRHPQLALKRLAARARSQDLSLVLVDPAPTPGMVSLWMREGASWCLGLPLKTPALAQLFRELLGREVSLETLEDEPEADSKETSSKEEFKKSKPPRRRASIGEDLDVLETRLVGESPGLEEVRNLILAAARTQSPVFIHGPTGTGKEVVASLIHDLSGRRDKPFIPVNCGALPEGLAESELFGSTKGAFTGAGQAREGLIQASDGGTLFLDELGEMPLELQVKLLRVLQEGTVRKVGSVQEEKVDLRVVAATNRDPEKAMQERRLREDLYFRLAVLRITLEPLRDRPEDLEPLSLHFLAALRERYGEGPRSISGDALEAFQSYPWPGNIRELQNVLDLVFALGEAESEIHLKHLPARFQNLRGRGFAKEMPETERAGSSESAASIRGGDYLRSESSAEPENDRTLTTLKDAELRMIQKALVKTGGNKAQAARLLGVSRPYLYRRLKSLEEGG